MNIFKKLTRNNIRLNKRRSAVTVVGITLSVALMVAVATVFSSLCESTINYEKAVKGNFHAAFMNVDKEGYNKIKSNRSIETIRTATEIGYANIESKETYKPYACLMEIENGDYEYFGINLVDGRYPENDSEIVIPTHLRTFGRLDYKVGDKILLEVGKRVNQNGRTLSINEPLSYDIIQSEENEYEVEYVNFNEKIKDTVKKEYTVTGIMEKPSECVESMWAPAFCFLTKADGGSKERINVYARWKKSAFDTFYKDVAAIDEIDADLLEYYYSDKAMYNEKLNNKCREEIEKEKYCTRINSYLRKLEINPLDDDNNRTFGQLVLIALAIIVVTSIFCIKNSFDISMTEKTRQYGMLRSVGATKKQLRKNVMYEATLLGSIGIVLGTIFGLLAARILVIVCNCLLGDYFKREIVFKIYLIPLIIAIVLSIITVYLSALRSSIRASKVAPIQSIRNNREIKIKRKKLKTPQFITKLFGVGGDISYKNIKRNRSKYTTTTISIIVSVVAFIALNHFMKVSGQEIKKEFGVYDYNLSINGHNEEIYNEICKMIKTYGDIDKYSIYNSTYVNVDSKCLNQDYMDFSEYAYEDEEESEYNTETIEILAMDEESFKEYLKELNLDINDVKDGAILNDYTECTRYDEDEDKVETAVLRMYNFKEGDTVSTVDEDKIDIKIVKCTDKKPFGIDELRTGTLIVNENEYKNLIGYNYDIFVCSDNASKLQDDIEEKYDSGWLDVDNKDEEYRNNQNLFMMIGIFLYGFITIITLIGITNMFNTITTNIYFRRREFATLRSVGMTNKEFNKMIRLESLFIGLKALIFGIPGGLLLSYYMDKKTEYETNFVPPVGTILVTVAAVFILIFVIMNYALSKVKKQNTIETIRNENI